MSNTETIIYLLKLKYIHGEIVANNFSDKVKEDFYRLKRDTDSAESRMQSPIEKIMFYILSNIEVLTFDTQVNIGRYRVDFLCSTITAQGERKFVIECDGHDFHEKTKEQAQKDKSRDRYLAALGYPVLRFTGSEIYSNFVSVMDEIYAYCEKLWEMNDAE